MKVKVKSLNKKVTLDPRTFGSQPAALLLAKLLNRHERSRRNVSRLLNGFFDTVHQLEKVSPIVTRGFFETMLMLARDKALVSAHMMRLGGRRRENIPGFLQDSEDIRSTTQNVICARAAVSLKWGSKNCLNREEEKDVEVLKVSGKVTRLF